MQVKNFMLAVAVLAAFAAGGAAVGQAAKVAVTKVIVPVMEVVSDAAVKASDVAIKNGR